MKNIFKYSAVIALSLVAFSACIKETVPESSTVTTQQLSGSASALTAAVSGLPAQLTPAYLIYGSSNQIEYDMGLPQFNIQFSEIMGDLFTQGSNSGYDWFNRWNRNKNMGDSYSYAQVPWHTLYAFVKSANDIIGSIDLENANDTQKGTAAIAFAFRAMEYMTLMTMYEPVTNPYTDITEVKGLTVPIITDETPESASKANPRATHEALAELINNDLTKAEELFLATGYVPESGMYPSLAVVYGLKARFAMIEQDWKTAADYARLAITTSGCTPLTQAQWEDPNSAFCDATANNSWMWYMRYSAENMGNLCNWTGWMAAESDWGYNSLNFFGINRWLYERIPVSDFRKHSFLDPSKYDFYDYKTSRDADFVAACPSYTSFKFRCKGGDWENYSVGGACDVPIMRVEEMYFIEAEALGMQNLAKGKEALASFMTQFRDASYSYDPQNVAAQKIKYGADYLQTKGKDYVEFAEELFFQKRIEFWGEGLTIFADYKRIQPGSYQAFEGTNAPGTEYYLNCDYVKPNCTFVIPKDELDSNTEIVNNPDPTDKVKAVVL